MIRGEEETWPNLLAKRHMLRTNPEFKVEYYQREDNKVAHKKAKKSSSFLNYVPKLYSITPLWLKYVIEADMPMEYISIGE